MDKNKLTLSIVIPARGEERYLKGCLETIAKQTKKPAEVIVVDNNSTDGTVKIAESYDFVQLLHEPRHGIVFARNTGFNAAKGDIIGRIDADTRLAPDWVENALKLFESSSDTAASVGKFYFFDFPYRQFIRWNFTLLYHRIQRVIAGTEILWGANMAIRTSAWRQARSHCHTRNDVAEDIDLSLNLHKAGLRIVRTDKLLAEVSYMRGNLSPIHTIRYISRWHKTYMRNRMYVRGAIIYLIKTVILLPIFVVYAVSVLSPRKSD